MAKAFTNIPFFRILIPFVLGLLLAISSSPNSSNIFVFILLILIALVLKFLKTQSTFTKRMFLVCLDVFFFLFAINLVSITNSSKQTNYYGNYLKKDSASFFIATINDLPVNKEKFVKCELTVNEIKTNSEYKKVKGTIIAYFKKSTNDSVLKAGTTLLINAKLLDVNAPQNPFEFDYKNYLYNKQIYHTAFVDVGAYDLLSTPMQLNAIWYSGLLMKQSILQKLKESALNENAYGICAALLTGYDDEIDKQVVEAFSHSGTLHVLSVSGLHTGLIYLVLSFMFDLIDKKRKYKIIKFLLITLLLWGFALITGFSAPVLRAVIMFNLLGFGKIFFRTDSRNQINILLVSAFLLLCYNPFFITDVGFLLSYFAMFGLLYFQPKLVLLWKPNNGIQNWLWQGTTASFAATLSTLPLTLFYFKQFPLWFFVCNLILVPASFVILILAFFIVLKFGFAAIFINHLTNWLIGFISFFNSSKFGFIDGVDFDFMDALFLSFLIITFSIFLNTKAYKQIVFCFVLFIVWQFYGLFSSFTAKNQSMFVVYQINKTNMALIKNKTNSVLNQFDSTQFNYHVKPHIISFNNSAFSVNDFNYFEMNNKRVLVLNKRNHWPAISNAKIDYLVLANNFNLSSAELEGFTSLKAIIMDGSNNNHSIKKSEELSRKFDIELIKTKQTGAYILNL